MDYWQKPQFACCCLAWCWAFAELASFGSFWQARSYFKGWAALQWTGFFLTRLLLTVIWLPLMALCHRLWLALSELGLLVDLVCFVLFVFETDIGTGSAVKNSHSRSNKSACNRRVRVWEGVHLYVVCAIRSGQIEVVLSGLHGMTCKFQAVN